jgi:hypothetical protein
MIPVENTDEVDVPYTFCLDFCITFNEASPYPATVEVSGLAPGDAVSGFRVILAGVNHTNPDDVDMMLEAPDGTAAVILSDAGGSADLTGETIHLLLGATTFPPNDGPLMGSVSYAPTDWEPGDTFPAPAPSAAANSAFVFKGMTGTQANGIWHLWIVDDTVGTDDAGSLADGWKLALDINKAPEIGLPSGPSTYVEGATPVQIESDATFLDPDTTSFNGASLSLTWTGGSSADRLAIRNQGTGPGLIGVAGTSVFYSGTEIGTFAGGGSNPLAIQLNGIASAAAIQALLRNLVFSVESESPGPSNRVFTLNFGTFENEGGSATVTKVVRVQPVADPPSISAVADLSINEDTATAPLPFTIGDVDTPASALKVTATSSNPGLLPPAGITVGGAGANRTIKFTPAANANGATVVSLNVSDGGLTTTEQLTLTVKPVPDPTLLRVRKLGSGGGTITSVPVGVACGVDCSETYEINTIVTLKAKPRLHSFFRGWSGPCRGRGDCVVKLSAGALVQATFVRPNCLGMPATRVGAGLLNGTRRDDVLVGTGTANTINGRGGNDRICTRGGADRAAGGPGDDQIHLGGAKDLGNGGPGNDRVLGGGGDDRLIGEAGADVLFGQTGDDVLNGGPGTNDQCNGGAGRDELARRHQCEAVVSVP